MMKPHKFGAENAEILLSEERKNEGSAESVIKFSGVGKNDAAVDFGCGPGFLTLPLAKKCRMVYAVDINQKMLEIVESRMRKEKAANILPVKSTEYTIRLPEKTNYVFALSLVHEVVRKRKMFEVFHNLLEEKGKLVVVDWRTDPKRWDFGPPLRERVSKSKMAELASGIFKLKKEKLMENQYYLLFEKV